MTNQVCIPGVHPSYSISVTKSGECYVFESNDSKTHMGFFVSKENLNKLNDFLNKNLT